MPLSASAPPSGTISPNGSAVMWDGTATGGASADESTCLPGVSCDSYEITLSGTPADWLGKQAKIEIKWTDSVNDYDLFIHKGDIDGPVIGSSAQGSTTSEQANIDPNSKLGASGKLGTGKYTVNVVYFAATAADQYRGVATSVTAPLPPTDGGPSPTPRPNPPGAPKFFNYTPPETLGRDAGEPTLGVNWKTGNVMFQAGLQTLRVTFDDCTSPARATWVNKPGPNTDITSLDPILFTDNVTGRTFVSQLTGFNSLSSFTDDDGETYTPSTGGPINSGVDHQSIGGGPFAAGDPGPVTSYPNAVYYSSQSIGSAFTGLSRDGGLTYNGNGGGIPMYTLAECGGLHGHPKVAPDGTVYVPNKGCGGEQAAAVSTDNGKTWTVRRVPNSKPGESDPSIGIGRNNVGKPSSNKDGTNTIYFGYTNVDGHARIAVSRDRGETWTNDQDVGAYFGVQNSVFPVVIAGDDNRAAFAFLGTPTAGAAATGQDPALFDGEWHLYIATTYDGGKTWVTTDATPTDAVQRGIVCTQGTLCESGRNLLDFMDVDIDKIGRILVGYADGCIDSCVDGGANSGTAVGTIARQADGRPLFAANDPGAPQAPRSPLVSATIENGKAVTLSWEAPFNGGSPITGYKVYRGNDAKPASLVASLPASARSYNDPNSAATNFYFVTATNAVGESAKCDKVFPEVLIIESVCTLPGKTVAPDPTGDQMGAPANSDLDIEGVFVAEPFFPNGARKLVFTMKVADLSTIPPNRQYRIIWTPKEAPSDLDDRYYVGMNSNSGGADAVTFEYGTVTSNGNVPTTQGEADSGSVDEDGTIRITVSVDKIGSPKPGDALASLSGRNFAGTGTATLTKTSATDSTGDSSYGVVGNATCGAAQATTLLNISSRARVQAGDKASIGGFIVTGDVPKKVILRGLGPSLQNDGAPVPGRLEDPQIELYKDGNPARIASNDNWKAEKAKVEATGLAPKNDREAALVRTLEPGVYTVILRGQNRSTGIGLVEVYDLALGVNSKLANISTRAFVETGDNALIGGFIAGPAAGSDIKVIVRAIGPSLKDQVRNALDDPTLKLFNANGEMIGQNDNWKSDQQAGIKATGLQPKNDRESAILVPSLAPGAYTAIVRGKNDTTGIGLVEIYALK